MKCPRCGGMVFADQAGDASCYVCGWEYVSQADRERGEWFVEWDAARSPRARTASPSWHIPSEFAR
jgi:uncharacterized Zn finger protein (UPF0148 family)